ncbi:MAG: hypothetical protein ACPGVT_11525 [Maricaulaceae bacterium]
MQKTLISLACLSVASLAVIATAAAQDTKTPAKTETSKPSTETKPAKPAASKKDKSLDQFFKDIENDLRENPTSCHKPDPVV